MTGRRKVEVEFSGPFTLPVAFEKFSKFGDPKSDGKTITLSQNDKWMKQAGVIGKKITTTDTGVCFNKFKARTINLADYDKFVQDLAKYKQVDYSDIITKLCGCGLPGQENKPVVSPAEQL